MTIFKNDNYPPDHDPRIDSGEDEIEEVGEYDETPEDEDDEDLSVCCSAMIINGLCGDCKEHC